MSTSHEEPALRDGLLRRAAEAVHLAALGVWAGAAAMSGVTASVVFGALRDLRPSLPDYSALGQDRHADLAAGWVQSRVFVLADAVQFGAAAVSLAALLVLLAACRLPLRRVSSAVRVLALGLALGLLSYNLMVLAPRMQTHLSGYWQEARAGRVEPAEAHYRTFREDHPAARYVLVGITLSVLAALLAGGFSAASLGGTQGGRPR